MPYSHILFESDDAGIALVTINRPDKLNALSGASGGTAPSFRADRARRLYSRRDSHRRGRKGVSSRARISTNWRELSAVEAREFALRGQQTFRMLETMPKPSVAAINGYALGGGLELAMACTVRFAAETAKMGQPEVKLGIICGYGGTQRLPRLVGRGRALELLLSGETITAAEAHRIGLVNAVSPQAELLDHSRAWLRQSDGKRAVGGRIDHGSGGCGPQLRVSKRDCASKPRPSASAPPPKTAWKARARSSKSAAPSSRESEHAENIEGQLSAAGLKFAIVVSRFNSFVTERLLAGALDALARAGADMEQCRSR